MALVCSSCSGHAPLQGRLAKSFHGRQSIGWSQNELRLVASSTSSRSSLETRKKRTLVVEATTFKDYLKSFVRFAYNTPLRFFLKELDHELDVAEERIKQGAKLIKEASHTVEKLAEAADAAAEDVSELVDKIEERAEKVYNELEEVLDEVELEKAAVKELQEKLEHSETKAKADEQGLAASGSHCGVGATPCRPAELERRGGGGAGRSIQLPRIVLRWNSGSRTARLEHRRFPVLVCCSEVNSSAGRAGRSRKKQEQSKTSLDVEREIFQFMQQSEKPNAFPSKEDLLEAGRSDLVDAVSDQGGWLAVRWETVAKRPKVNGHARVSKRLLKDRTSQQVPSEIASEELLDDQSSQQVPPRVASGESLDDQSSPNVDGSGNKDLEGLPSVDGSAGRMQSDIPTSSSKQRRAKFRERFDTSELDAALQRARAEILSFKEQSSRRHAPNERESGRDPESSARNQEVPATLELALERAQAKAGKDNEGEGEEGNRERRRKKRLEEAKSRRTGESSVNTALDWVKDMVSKREELIQQLRSKSSDASPSTPPDLSLPVKPRSRGSTTTSRTRTRKGGEPASTSKSKPALSDIDSSFAGRVRRLEDKLLATRAALKSGRTALLKGEDRLMQVQRRTSEEFAKASDSLEFRESEIMQTRAELRRTRAQVVALQARYAVELSEARKETEEKQALLDRAERALRLLRLVRIVWPNPASQVLLAGSFDGWTNKIPMERSGAGVFVTSLQLYPGRYEIKFVVDGTWRVDACRPITYLSDGIENNVLMVS